MAQCMERIELTLSDVSDIPRAMEILRDAWIDKVRRVSENHFVIYDSCLHTYEINEKLVGSQVKVDEIFRRNEQLEEYFINLCNNHNQKGAIKNA